MTFSILAFDEKSGAFGAAAATGSLCVGGWVLRGDIDSGLVASQGTSPSTFWRDDALRAMHQGLSASAAVAAITQADAGRAHRQLVAMDRWGATAGFTGDQSIDVAVHRCGQGLAVAGNMLSGQGVLDALGDAFAAASGPMAERLIAALEAAEREGGDFRGLKSAALQVYAMDAPPLDLRIDHSVQPLKELRGLYRQAGLVPYADWLDAVPVAEDRSRSQVLTPKARATG